MYYGKNERMTVMLVSEAKMSFINNSSNTHSTPVLGHQPI
jgi:hypothetical protein